MNRCNGTWVKNMCKKFEDMCLEIDHFVCKEPILFVGNQMETVGGNVKNFFSSFVDEYVPQAVDRVQRHVAHLTPSKCDNMVGTSKIPVVEIKENTVDSNTNCAEEATLVSEVLCHKATSTADLSYSEQITSEISQYLFGEECSLINNTSDNTTQVNLSASTSVQNLDNSSEEEETLYDASVHGDTTGCEYSHWGIENILDDLDFDTDNVVKGEPCMNLEENNELLNELTDGLECDFISELSDLEGSVTCSENKEENTELIIAGRLSSEKLDESFSLSFGTPTVEPVTIDCSSPETVDYFSASSDSVSSNSPFTTLAYDISDEASYSGTGLADGSTADFEDGKKDTVESYVVPKGGKLSGYRDTTRSKSYKKMIKDAFMTRKRLTKEYKQLAVLYGDVDNELSHTIKESSELAALDLPDSEWELL